MAITDGEIHLNETVSDQDEDQNNQSSEASDADYESDGGDAAGNAGWADSIAKILKTNKPKNKKTLVLSKAKKLTDIKREKRKHVGFQVETVEGKVKEEVVVEEAEDTKEPLKKKKRDLLPKLRVKPDILEKDRERKLSKIATKGVVQLFNAVRMQQKDIQKKVQAAGPLDVRRDKALKSIDKRTFLDVLMGEKSEVVDDNEDAEKSEPMEFV